MLSLIEDSALSTGSYVIVNKLINNNVVKFADVLPLNVIDSALSTGGLTLSSLPACCL